MHVATDGTRLALQPEDVADEELLYALFSAFEPPACWFTLDVAEYDGLDHALARERAESPGTGPFAPGTRALVISVDELAVKRPSYRQEFYS
jgi:hypothetical protein